MRKLKKFVKNRILKLSHQRKDMDRTRKKWELIKKYLPEEPGSLLDIGSSEGYFTRNAGSLGWCSFGIERLGSAVNYSNKMAKKEKNKNVFFAQGEMNLTVAKNLPDFDVIIMASTFQEICSAYGLEEGYQIFDNILR
ncbi:MAG: class I SAM-dependent methyltransferase, partial [bacterium]